MAKKVSGSAKSDIPTPTPAEHARQLAEQYAQLLEQAKTIAEKLEALKAEIVAYANEHEDFDLGAVQVINGKGKPKIDFGTMTKKAQDQLLARLKNDLPDFVINKSELDVESLFFAQGTNAAVQNALKANGIKILETETCQVRRVK